MAKSSSNSTGKRKIHKVMKEYKEGDLKVGQWWQGQKPQAGRGYRAQ